jgi:hypothetical protein
MFWSTGHGVQVKWLCALCTLWRSGNRVVKSAGVVTVSPSQCVVSRLSPSPRADVCLVTSLFLAELPSDEGNEYADSIQTLVMVLDVIVLATRYTSLTRTPPSFGAPLPSDRRLRQQPC